ncbi:MAG: hypothetical protein WC402_05900 [Candidatus Pacearchaeota archaeon]|jgi:hypothetical protein
MTNQTLTQKVLFNADENQKPRGKSRFLSNYIKVPVVTLGIAGSLWLGALGVCKYQNMKADEAYAQKQIRQEEARQERVLKIAQDKEEEPNTAEQIFTTFFDGDYSYSKPLTKNERKFIEQYRNDHPEYAPKEPTIKKSYQPKSAEERRIEEEKIRSMENSIKNYREMHK